MLKKTAIATAVALTLGMSMGAAQAKPMGSATFTMYSSGGNSVGVDTTVTGAIGGGTFSVASTTSFFGAMWTAHGGTTFGPGTYSFDTQDGGTPGPTYTGIVVGANQVGGHILFNWNGTANIDVVNVWDVTTNADGSKTYHSTDGIATNPANPDGIRGYGMIDGPFKAYNANFDFSAVPVPAAVWLFGSGLLGLAGVARRKKAA